MLEIPHNATFRVTEHGVFPRDLSFNRTLTTHRSVHLRIAHARLIVPHLLPLPTVIFVVLVEFRGSQVWNRTEPTMFDAQVITTFKCIYM